MCLVKDDRDTNDVTDMRLLVRIWTHLDRVFSRIVLPQSTSKAAERDIGDILVSMHACMHALAFNCLHLIPPPG